MEIEEFYLDPVKHRDNFIEMANHYLGDVDHNFGKAFDILVENNVKFTFKIRGTAFTFGMATIDIFEPTFRSIMLAADGLKMLDGDTEVHEMVVTIDKECSCSLECGKFDVRLRLIHTLLRGVQKMHNYLRHFMRTGERLFDYDEKNRDELYVITAASVEYGFLDSYKTDEGKSITSKDVYGIVKRALQLPN